MSETLEAIYENGVFKPLKAPGISEGQHVRLTVETASETTPEELLNLAAKVYQGLSDKKIHEIQANTLYHTLFFSQNFIKKFCNPQSSRLPGRAQSVYSLDSDAI